VAFRRASKAVDDKVKELTLAKWREQDRHLTTLDVLIKASGADTYENRMDAIREQEKPSFLVQAFASTSKAVTSGTSMPAGLSRSATPDPPRTASPTAEPQALDSMPLMGSDTGAPDPAEVDDEDAQELSAFERRVSMLQTLENDEDSEDDDETSDVDSAAAQLVSRVKSLTTRRPSEAHTYTPTPGPSSTSEIPAAPGVPSSTAAGEHGASLASSADPVDATILRTPIDKPNSPITDPTSHAETSGEENAPSSLIDGLDIDTILASLPVTQVSSDTIQYQPMLFDESKEMDALRLPAPVLRAHGMAFILRPILARQVFLAQVQVSMLILLCKYFSHGNMQADGGKYLCQRCKKFPSSNKRHGHAFKTERHLRRHM
jgi:hypothetical protein